MLDRVGDPLLDLLRVELRDDRVDLDLNRGDVRERIDVEACERHQSKDGKPQGHGDNRDPVVQREVDDASEHE